MNIEYKEIKKFKKEDLQQLFLSINWESGNYPNKLVKAMANSTYVISAWDSNRLVGLVRALSDGETVGVIHYLLVNPAYQGMHIGDELMKILMKKFDNLLYVKVMPENHKVISFYERYGFKQYDNYSAMVRKNFNNDIPDNNEKIYGEKNTDERAAFIESLEKYVPYNEQEEMDKKQIIDFINDNEDAFLRDNKLAHITASAWIVNKTHDKVLMCYHRIYDSWSWLGGHADGDMNLLRVAIKEAKEESGLNNIEPVSNDIYSLESLTVDGHIKKGKYVSSHLHLNVTYLLEADEAESLTIKEDENSGVRWFTPEDALKASTEPWFVKNIYSKLNKKLTEYVS